jgi:hypothetical protein
MLMLVHASTYDYEANQVESRYPFPAVVNRASHSSHNFHGLTFTMRRCFEAIPLLLLRQTNMVHARVLNIASCSSGDRMATPRGGSVI